MNFIGQSVQLGGKVFESGLYEKDIGKSAAGRRSMDLLGDLLQRPGIGVDADEELTGIAPRAAVHKEPFAGPDIDDDSFPIGSDELEECVLIELLAGSAADSLQHGLVLYPYIRAATTASYECLLFAWIGVKIWPNSARGLRAVLSKIVLC